MSIELKLGDWRTALADVEVVDALICDPPYSERTHGGSDAAADRSHNKAYRKTLLYQPWSEGDAVEFVRSWAPRVRSWFCVMTDDILAPTFRAAFRAAGRYDFAPVPIVQHKPRLSGDGPASACVYLMASRPRESRFMQWGSLPGFYLSRPEHADGIQGAKPLDLMRAIVRDYSRPGDIVCDPCGGGFTTALAAAIEGRRAISCELDPDTFAKGKARIAKGYTPATLFADVEHEQLAIEI